MLKPNIKKRERIVFRILVLLAVLVNLSAINTAFFSDDPGLYGSVAKQLIYRHEFFSLYSYGHDWLDKPHLPFWLILLSFKIFGIHTWSYKLPALLCFLLSLHYTWKFTSKYYGKLTAIMAVLIVSTSLHIIMSNADVRAEPYLMAFIIGAIYHLSNLEYDFSRRQVVMAALLTACAIMTKGIFVIVPIYGALAGQLILQARYWEMFRLKWLTVILLTILFITPELYALYTQFDMHPEKLVFHKTHVSGIKWFLWDSQFGRFTNEGPITRPSGDILFFVHTLLWAFAPWCLLFYFALARAVKRVVTGFKQHEYYALSGGLILLVVFSVSGFQLPFYTNIIYPLFAIITANFCAEQLNSKRQRVFRMGAQLIYITLFPLVIVLLDYFLRPHSSYWAIIGIALLILLVYVISRAIRGEHVQVFLLNCAVMMFVGIYLNTTLYPILLSYKGQNKAADAVNNTIPANQLVYSLKDLNSCFQFYCNRPLKYLQYQDFEKTTTQKNAVFYADEESVTYFNNHHYPYVIINTFWDYPQEHLLPAFINYKTRQTTLEKVYLIKKP